MEDKLGKIKEHCENKKDRYIDNAVTVIQYYVNALKLDEYLFKFRECKREYERSENAGDIIPNAGAYTNDLNGGYIPFDTPYYFYDPKSSRLFKYYIALELHDHNLYVSSLQTCSEDYSDNKMTKYEPSKNPKRSDEGKLIFYDELEDMQKHGSWALDHLTKMFDFVKLPSASEEEYLKKRRHIVAVLDAIKASPKMREFILNLGKIEEKRKRYAKDWHIGIALSKMIQEANACDAISLLKNLEKRMIAYDVITYEESIGFDPTSEHNKERKEAQQDHIKIRQKGKEEIHEQIRRQQYEALIKQLLAMLRDERTENRTELPEAPYVLATRTPSCPNVITAWMDAAAYSVVSIKNTETTTKEQIEDPNTRGDMYRTMTYPNVLITVMDYYNARMAKSNNLKTEIAFQLKEGFMKKQYRLVSVVTKDILTGEIYAEERCNDMENYWLSTKKGADSKLYKFDEKPDSQLRLMAIYELEN